MKTKLLILGILLAIVFGRSNSLIAQSGSGYDYVVEEGGSLTFSSSDYGSTISIGVPHGGEITMHAPSGSTGQQWNGECGGPTGSTLTSCGAGNYGLGTDQGAITIDIIWYIELGEPGEDFFEISGSDTTIIISDNFVYVWWGEVGQSGYNESHTFGPLSHGVQYYVGVYDAANNITYDTCTISQATPSTYDITFTVTDGSTPISGATVSLEGETDQTTNSSGQTIFNKIDGTYDYTVTFGCMTASGVVTVNGGLESVSVTLQDTTDPEITSTHNDLQVDADTNCETILPDYTGEVTATDNCSDFANMTVTQTPSAGTTISGATNSVTLKVEDEAGNFSEVSFNVEVVDNTNPEITSTHEAQTVDTDINCEASLADYRGEATATDNCSDFVDMTVTQTPSAGTTISGATNSVTLKVEDESGNYAEVSFNVEVVDSTDPTITCVGDQEYDADATHSYTVVGTDLDPVDAGDNCGGVTLINDFNDSSTLEGAELPQGITTVTWTATDEAGNQTACSFDITVDEHVSVDVTGKTLRIYPNPVSTTLHVDAKEFDCLQIYDIGGKLIYQDAFDGNPKEVDFSNIPYGVYVVKLTGLRTISRKVIVLKH
jgi:hypothetical protein